MQLTIQKINVKKGKNMEYSIGDIVELESGKIVKITKIDNFSDGLVYGYGYPTVIPITEK